MMINSEVFQIIYDELSQYLSEGWERLVVYLEYGEASYSFSFFEKVNDEYIKCFDIPDISEEALDSSFGNIYETTKPERDKLEDKWSNMTMVVESNGEMHTDFDYTDLSSGNYKYLKEWKKSYLV